MAEHNYGFYLSDEICEDIAETSLVEENYPTPKPPVPRSGAPAYDEKDKLRALDVFEDSATIPPKPLIFPHNKKLPPLPPSLGPPAVRVSHDERSSPVLSANGLPEVWEPSPPPYSPPINQVKLLLLKLRKI